MKIVDTPEPKREHYDPILEVDTISGEVETLDELDDDTMIYHDQFNSFGRFAD